MNREQIRAATFVRHVEIHNELDSTNTRAAELARDISIELPALILARQQTADRGRSGRNWWSEEGALMFSLLIEPTTMGISTSDWPRLSLTTSVAVCDSLRSEAPQANFGIKWPNDVVLDGSKVGGILIESPGIVAPIKDRLIIGIGINVNNSWQKAPRDAGPCGTALCDVTAKRHELQTILVDCVQAIEKRSKQLAASAPELSETWRHLDWLTEQTVEIHTNNGRLIEGICLEVDRDGALVVENVFGHHRVYSGSVRVK